LTTDPLAQPPGVVVTSTASFSLAWADLAIGRAAKTLLRLRTA
jgi:hypothetical protein